MYKTDAELHQEYLDWCKDRNIRAMSFRELLKYGILDSKRHIEKLIENENGVHFRSRENPISE